MHACMHACMHVCVCVCLCVCVFVCVSVCVCCVCVFRKTMFYLQLKYEILEIQREYENLF